MKPEDSSGMAEQATKNFLDYAVDFQPTIITLIVVAVLIGLLILFRKELKPLLNRLRKILLEVKGVKAHLELDEHNAEPNREKNTLLNPPEEDESEDSGANLEFESFTKVSGLLDEGQIEEAEAAIKKLCDAEENDTLRYLFRLNFLYQAFKRTQNHKYLDAIRDIFDTSQNDWELVLATQKLLTYFNSCRDYKNSYGLIHEALEKITEETYKAMICDDLCELLIKDKKYHEAIEVVTLHIKGFTNQKAIASLWDSYSDVLSAMKDIESSTLAKDKTVQLKPGDTDTLFNAAYKQADTSMANLAAINYQTIVDIDPKHANAHNNLGVYCENNGFQILKIKHYKTSIEEGNTLAMANLAYAYMNAGFIEDAKTILDEAKSLPDVHPNVNEAISKLESLEDEERTKWKDHLDQIEQIRPMLWAYTDASLLQENASTELPGDWISDKGDKLSISHDATSGVISSEWESSRKVALAQALGVENNVTQYRLKGTISGRAAKIVITRKGDKNGGILTYSDTSTAYLAYLSDDSQQLILLPEEYYSEEVKTFTREGAL